MKWVAGALCAIALGCATPRSEPLFKPLLSMDTLDSRLAAPSHSPGAQKYAVIIRGSDEDRFVKSVKEVYERLLGSGFEAENVYVLTGSAAQAAKGDAFYHPVDGFATKGRIRDLFCYLQQKIDEEDTLVLYMRDHGGGTHETESHFYLDHERFIRRVAAGRNVEDLILKPEELRPYLAAIRPKMGLLVFDFCFSGDFAEKLGHGPYIAVASAHEDQRSRSSIVSSFGLQFFRGLENGDADADGRVTVEEMMRYASENHPYVSRERLPVLKSTFDPRVGLD